MRVTIVCADLLFGSKLEGALSAAGHDVARVDHGRGARASDAVVVDLTDPAGEGLTVPSELPGVPALGFYSHVDQETRRRAEEAGFDRVVPRSRMAREAAALVEGLAEEREERRPGLKE